MLISAVLFERTAHPGPQAVPASPQCGSSLDGQIINSLAIFFTSTILKNYNLATSRLPEVQQQRIHIKSRDVQCTYCDESI